MKNTENDKLLDFAEKLKLDDEYIDEALTGSSEKYGTKVYAGKSRISPMRIAAPIAACLAVFAAAGILFANRNRLPIRNSGEIAASSSESTENGRGEIINIANPDYSIKIYPHIVPIWQDSIFEKNCESFILDKYADLLQGEITWWKDGAIDIDFDGEYEQLLCPQVDYETVEGVDVCVFRRVGLYSEAEYIGSLGGNFSKKYFDDIYFVTDNANKCYYYFDSTEENGKCVDTVQKIYFDRETNSVRVQPYLQLVKTHPNGASSDTMYTAAYRYGEEITVEQLLDEWSGIQSSAHDWEIMPTPNVSGAHSEMDECVQLLVDKYDLTMNSSALHRAVQFLDINQDGKDETVIEFRNCEQLKGIYVFSSDGKLIGEFDLEGYRGQSWGISGGMSTHTDEDLFLYNGSGESYYFYKTSHTGSDTLSIWLEEEIYRIAVNSDGTLSAVAVAECSYEGDDRFMINGKEVSKEEYQNEERKYAKYLNYAAKPFVW